MRGPRVGKEGKEEGRIEGEEGGGGVFVDFLTAR